MGWWCMVDRNSNGCPEYYFAWFDIAWHDIAYRIIVPVLHGVVYRNKYSHGIVLDGGAAYCIYDIIFI